MPRKGNKYVGDCSVKGVAKQAKKIYKKSNVSNPVKTGNVVIDHVLGSIPLIKSWNKGFNVGKLGFVANETYKTTCKRKR